MGRPVLAARRVSVPGIALALALTTLACGDGREERDAAVALALLLENQERCDAVADDVAETLLRAGSSARSAVAGYYEGEGAGATAAAARALEILEAAMVPVGRAEGEARDALLELYAAHSRLCELALSSAGLGSEAFGSQHAELRAEFAGTRARLGVLLPLTETERRQLTAPFAAEIAAARKAADAQAAAALAEAPAAPTVPTFQPDPEVEAKFRETELLARDLEHRRERAEAAGMLQEPDFKRRLDEWYRLYRRQFVPIASRRLELELPLKLRRLGLVVPDCQRLLAATDGVNRISLLTAPDDRINAALAASVDLFQRAARSCTEAQLDLAYETFAEADAMHREVVRLLSLYGLDPGP